MIAEELPFLGIEGERPFIIVGEEDFIGVGEGDFLLDGEGDFLLDGEGDLVEETRAFLQTGFSSHFC